MSESLALDVLGGWLFFMVCLAVPTVSLLWALLRRMDDE
jgi:hypothetical protein